MRSVFGDIVWGVKYGLFLGAFYAFFGVGIFILSGSHAIGQLNAVNVLLLYLAAGTAGGAIVGIFRPYTARRQWASVVGMVALLPMGFGTIAMAHGPISSWDFPHYFAAIGGSILLGGFGGYKFWELRFFTVEALMQKRERAPNKRKNRSRSRRGQ